MTNEPRAPEYTESDHSQALPGPKPAGPPPAGDTVPENSNQGQSGGAGPDGTGSNNTSAPPPPYSSEHHAISKTPPKNPASVTDDDESVKRGEHDHR